VNRALRRADARTREALVEAMDRTLDALVARDARAFFEHCGNRLSAPSIRQALYKVHRKTDAASQGRTSP
jgi:hypothetical protein